MNSTRNNDLLFDFVANKPAPPGSIEKCQANLNFTLPTDYVAFMREMNGGEGFVGKGGYLILWPIEELIDLNLAYQVPDIVPGLFVFGSNGGGEAFAFDTRSPECPIVMVPFIVMEFEAVLPVARDFESFLQARSPWDE